MEGLHFWPWPSVEVVRVFTILFFIRDIVIANVIIIVVELHI